MWLLEIAVPLTAIVLLSAYLVFRLERRQSGEPPPAPWNGRAFCEGTVSWRIRRLRQNHLAGLPMRTHAATTRKRRLALARQTVGQLPYFQHLRPQADPAQDAPSHPSGHRAAMFV